MKTNTQYLLERINNVEHALTLFANQLGTTNSLIAGSLNSLVSNMHTTANKITNDFVADHFGRTPGGAPADVLVRLIRQYLSLSQGGYPLTRLPNLEAVNEGMAQIKVSGVYRKPNNSISFTPADKCCVIAICTVEGTLLYDVEFQHLRAIAVVGELGLIEADYHGQFNSYMICDAIHRFFVGLGRPELKPISSQTMEKEILSEANCLTRHDLLSAGGPEYRTGACFVGEIEAPVFAYRFQLPNGEILQVAIEHKEGEYRPSVTGIDPEYWASLPYATQNDFLTDLKASVVALRERPAEPVKNDARGE